MSNNKPLIGIILTMIITYLMVSFIKWDLNAKHWDVPIRGMFATLSPIFSVLIYLAIKNEQDEQQ